MHEVIHGVRLGRCRPSLLTEPAIQALRPTSATPETPAIQLIRHRRQQRPILIRSGEIAIRPEFRHCGQWRCLS